MVALTSLTLALTVGLLAGIGCTGRPFAFGPRIGEPNEDGGVLLPDGRVVRDRDAGVIPCLDSVDCGTFGRCSDGICVPFGNEPCSTIDDCNLGEYCIQNSCTFPSIGGSCAGGGDCNLGEECIDGQCISPNGTCIDESDCPVGSSCDSFTASCAMLNPPCLQDSECPDGYGCGASGCEPLERMLCSEDGDCGSGSCVGGYCDNSSTDPPDPMPQG